MRGSARTAASSRGPSRIASAPARYPAGVRPATTASIDRDPRATAAAQAGSPGWSPAEPVGPTNHTPPIAIAPFDGVQASGDDAARHSWSRTRSWYLTGQRAESPGISASHRERAVVEDRRRGRQGRHHRTDAVVGGRPSGPVARSRSHPQPIAQPPPPPVHPPRNPISNDSVSRSKVRLRDGLCIGSQPSPALAGSLTCMTTSTDRPRGGPAKDRETSGNEGVLRDGIACSLTHFQGVLAGRQSGLHRIPKPRVAGSIPAGGTEEFSKSFRGADRER
jgi:hypothetical protein